MTKTLELVFRNDAGREVVLRLTEPKDDVTLAQAQAVMQNIVTKNIFHSTGGDLVQAVDARISTRDTASLV